MRCPELFAQFLQPHTARHRERANRIRQPRLLRRNKVRQAPARFVPLPVRLLPQKLEPCQHLLARAIRVQFHIVARRVRRKKSVHAARRQQPLRNHPIQQRIPLREDLPRLFALLLILKNSRIHALQFPRMKKRAPIDELSQHCKGKILQHAHTKKRWLRQVLRLPLDRRPPRPRRLQRHNRPPRRGIRLAQRLIFSLMARHKLRFALFAQQARRHRHSTARVQHVHHRFAVVGRDLHRRVRPAGRRSANQQRQLHSLPLHLPRHVYHLVQRRRNQPAQPHNVRPHLSRALQNLLRRNHHAHVDHFVVVAGQHHSHNVLPNVVHVSLHRRQHDLSLHPHRLARRGHLRLLRLHKRRQVRNRLLHHARRFHHLRQKHLSRAEQVAHYAHAIHQRPLDHRQRPSQLHARLLGIRLDVLIDSLHQRVRKPLLHRAVAPFLYLFLVAIIARARSSRRFQRLAERDQPFRSLRPPVQQHILHQFLQPRLDLLVNLQHARIHDTHIQPRGDRMVQERPVHGLAHFIVAAKAEGDIRHASAHLRVRQILLDPARCPDEIDRVVVVLLHSRRHGQDVRIEDNVLRLKSGLIHKNPVGARADPRLVLEPRCLPLLVESHHHRRRAILQHRRRVLAKLPLALLQRNRVHNALALQALQPRLNHLPLRGVDHERNLCYFGLAGQQLQIARHRGYAVDHPLIHADVEYVRAVLYLLPRHAYGLFVLAFFDQLGELRRPGHVGPLADQNEDAGLLREGLRSRQSQWPCVYGFFQNRFHRSRFERARL